MVRENGLIEIKPFAFVDLSCFHCGIIDTQGCSLLFQGIHTLAVLSCEICRKSSYHTLPVGHDLLFPISFDETGKKVKGDYQAMEWLVKPLINSMFKNARVEITIEREVIIEEKREAIILNCIDNCFGHTFSKLWNASVLTKKYPEKSVIVFLPKVMRWLVPEGVSEIWSFDSYFSNLEKYIVNLDSEVKQNLLPRFEKVWMSKAYTHLDLSKVDLQAMLKTDRFDLNTFSTSPPQITFILREDRCWHRYAFEFFLFKVFVKLKLSKKIFVLRQNYLVNKTIRLVKRELKEAKFSAVGLGKTGNLLSSINDQRKIKLTFLEEKDWCLLYSRSHIVVGIHGSNMLIPTALSAGFVEILPRHKIRHISEDTLMDYNSRYTHFLGRYVDHFASPRLISQHIVSMNRDFPYIRKNTEQPV